MIRQEKLESALYALHVVLVELRSMSFEGVDSAVMAELLDWAEAMPFLIAQHDKDRTDSFRSHLAGIADKCPRFHRVLSAFDENCGFYG
jgi:hypothetical protein